MSKNKQNINQFLKGELTNVPVQGSIGKSFLFSLRIVMNNFVQFSALSFNVYYAAVIVIPTSVIVYNEVIEKKEDIIISTPHCIVDTLQTKRIELDSIPFVEPKVIPEPQIEDKAKSKLSSTKTQRTLPKIKKSNNHKIDLKKVDIINLDTVKQTIFGDKKIVQEVSTEKTLQVDTLDNVHKKVDTSIHIKDTLTIRKLIKSKRRKKRRK